MPEERDPARPDGQALIPHDNQYSIPADFALRTPELDELEVVLTHMVQPHRLIPRTRGGQTRGEFEIHGVDSIGTFNVRFGRDVDAQLAPGIVDHRIAFAFASSGQGRYVVGAKEFALSRRSGVIVTPDLPRILRFAEDCDTSVLVMDTHRVTEHCAKLLGRDLEAPIGFETRIDLDTEAGGNWLRLAQYATAELRQPHSFMRDVPAARRQLEQMLLTGLLFSVSHSYTDALLRPQPSAAPFYIRRAEAYIEAHYAEPVSLADIATHAGVSARSLQNGFQNFRRMTPMAFLRSVRLQKAHQALLAADPAESTVTGIALACGFGHLGEFATLYKRRYGTTPRQTLAKAV